MDELTKQEVKRLTVVEVASGFDKMADTFLKEKLRLEGERQGYTKAGVAVESLLAHVDKDRDDGVISQHDAQLLKRWLSRGVELLRNLGLNATSQVIRTEGKQEGVEHALAAARRLVEKLSQPVEAQMGGRLPGERPENVNALRKAESKELTEQESPEPTIGLKRKSRRGKSDGKDS